MHYAEAKMPDGSRARTHMDNLREATHGQLSTLCYVFNQVIQPVYSPRGMEGSDVPDSLRAKAADTAEGILHQIDNIVDDMRRWTGDPSQLERHYTEMMAASADMQRAHALKAKLDTLPRSRVPVTLHEYEPGVWGAFLMQGRQARLVASGPTMNDALNAFDTIFFEGEKKPRQARKKGRKKADGPSSDPSSGPA